MTSQPITLPLAFLAGLLSFASPCVLPLVPAYMGYLGGTAALTAAQPTERRNRLEPSLHALLFVLGFTLVFVLLGASATLVGRVLFDFRGVLARVGGVLLVVFGTRLLGTSWSRRAWLVAAAVVALFAFAAASGLLTLGQLAPGGDVWLWCMEGAILGLAVAIGAKWSLARQVVLAAAAGVLNYYASFSEPVPRVIESLLIVAVPPLFHRTEVFYAERRLELGRSAGTGMARSFLFGVVFAAGWTPCLGPILAAILLLASGLETVGQGVLLLTAYSLGLGIPFLLVGLAFAPLAAALRKMSRWLRFVTVISGVLLVAIGVLIFTDSLAFLARYGNFFELEL